MENIRILNKKEKNNILAILKKQFGYSSSLDYVFLRSQKNKIFVVNKDISKINLDALRINSLGLYIGEIIGNEMRLSIEGSQLIGPQSSKNIIDLTFEEQLEWLKGRDLEKSEGEDAFKLIKHKNDFLGCGKQKNNKILNYIPKARRLAIAGEYF